MPDYAVHFTFINKTSERLEQDPDETKAVLGHWVDLPDTIRPHGQAVFQIADDFGFSGSEAYNGFFVKTNIDSKERSHIHTYAACPFTHDNAFTPDALTPKAVYTSSFRARSASGDWQDNSVPTSGHPLFVEYTVDYQSRPYRFTLVKLTATSDHPLRNSRGDLITGVHTLWDSDTAPKWADGKTGSFAPNAFAYKSGTSVAGGGHVNVTIRPLDLELISAEVIVYGSVGGKLVFQTDYFFIKSLSNRVVTAHIIDPARSSDPFLKKGDVEWSMQLRQSRRKVQAVGPSATRLELYWIGKKLHPAFWNGIPVGFLRSVFDKVPTEDGHRVKRFNQTSPEWYKYLTIGVFERYHKRYDTCNGASAFGMTVWGGIFAESYYRAVAPDSVEEGTLYRTVNCFDQAGMLELTCSLSLNAEFTSWLLQQPFGFIQTTHLVGIADDNGALIQVNNPFFGTDTTRAMVGNDDPSRTYFHSHVYVGSKKPFDLQNDYVYDACAGPHIGDENAAAYLAASRQEATETTLYTTDNTYPGRVDTIAEGSGVTGINGQPYQPSGPHGVPLASATSRAAVLTSLVGAPPELSTINITHVDWAYVDSWVSEVLGAGWSVAFSSVTAGQGIARAFWHLERSHGNTSSPSVPAVPVRVSVAVESVIAADGSLDVQRSTAAARDRATELLFTTEREPEGIWAPGSADLGRYGDYAYQHRPDLVTGRIVVVAANTVVDISGEASTAALAPIAHQLLERVVRRDVRVLEPPAMHRGRTAAVAPPGHSPGDVAPAAPHSQYDRDNHVVSLQHPGSRLTLEFDVDGEIAVAGASSPGGKVLLDRYTAERGSGTARFELVARESGTSTVALHVAHDRTMVSATHVVTLHVE